jgi:hypothetical protein
MLKERMSSAECEQRQKCSYTSVTPCILVIMFRMNNFGVKNLLHRTVWLVVISVYKESVTLYFTMKMESVYSFEMSARSTL